MEALEGAGLHADAVPESLVAEICPPRPCGDGDAGGRTGGETHLAVAEEGNGADVALAKAVGADRLEARLDQMLARERHGQIEDVGGAVESVHVFAQAEDRRPAIVAFVAADALEDGEPVVQRVREHVDLRLVPGDEPPVEPDPLGLLHRPPASPKPSRNANYVAAAPSRRS